MRDLAVSVRSGAGCQTVLSALTLVIGLNSFIRSETVQAQSDLPSALSIDFYSEDDERIIVADDVLNIDSTYEPDNYTVLVYCF
ncbi:hypothetical protein BV321_01106 [Pseudomonas syringae pv. actinidiae]|nr:hypothetical protein BV343_01031 [Pseudomonas syringae pv. actinidiae]OSN45404.1 hypothetical protein BV344_01034 [Pseudomonas syringae pv. actinidiae]OSR44538.1 hypothetical protein BV321_01106 [Pseudomonas syringae pv. actinidiae]OSR45724.1 hypothetical protein BV322_01095 [Pseudomonas syringae pv. actinidiae]OSS06316.1 hypothetical protein BV332_00926 [Pseudomonas syringae pv. actinidiae]